MGKERFHPDETGLPGEKPANKIGAAEDDRRH